MDFRLLGPVAVHTGGQRLALGSPKERTVLAALALDVGRPVPIDTLIGRLWDGAAPAHARESTHSYVSRLRGRLGKAARTPDAPRITRRDHAYVLEADPGAVDRHRFQHLLRLAAQADDTAAIRLLREADDLWQGEALTGLTGHWAETVRRSLGERRLAAATSRISLGLRLGHYRDLVPDLDLLVAEHPDDETLLGLLTLAYYGSERYTDALRVYDRARQVLMEQYGTRPGDALKRIYVGVLRQKPVEELIREAVAPRPAPPATTPSGASAPPATPSGPSAPPAEPAVRHVPRSLPNQPPLIGRQTELRLLTAAFGTPANSAAGAVVALESVSGMGGIGKTAVAVQSAAALAASYPDGCVCLDLRGHSAVQEPMTAADALTRLLREFGTPSAELPLDVGELAELWRTTLAERRAVIVLDDVADAAQVRPLLPHGTPSLIILTSRRHLTGLPAARALHLDVLPPADATALFRRFAGDDRTADDDAVARIVHLVGYLPLAIELVANRFQARTAWTLATLHDRLTGPDRLDQIHDTDGTALRPAFQLSYLGLPLPQRQAFRRLSLHPGPDITVPVAAAILNVAPGAAENLIEGLLSAHMLREPVADRCTFHDLLHEYAVQLVTSEDDEPLREHIVLRLAHYYVQAVDEADRVAYRREPRISGEAAGSLPRFADAAAAIAWLAAERENVLAVERMALARGYTALAAQLAFSLSGYLNAECYWPIAVELLTCAVAHWPADASTPHLCRAHLRLSDALASTAQYDRAADAARSALDLAVELADTAAEAEALRAVGTLCWYRGEHTTALEHLQRAYAIAQSSGDKWLMPRLHNNLGVALLHLGDNDRALDHLQEARRGFAETGNTGYDAVTLNNIGDLLRRKGELDHAREVFEEAVSRLDRSGNRHAQATARSGLADVLTELGESDAALDLCRAALTVFESLADSKGRAGTLISMGRAFRAHGDSRQAETNFTEALGLAQEIGAARQEIQALRGLAQLDCDAGRLGGAAFHAQAALALASRTQDSDEVVETHVLLAEVRRTSGALPDAYALLQHAFDVAQARKHRETSAIGHRLMELRDRLPH
ncbi:AfsR/SARP family transcriptional regulator [Streptomyces sp. NRRL F-5123]|uniref:AfsR/SARP family transcriptional regulator n=1 Tax=Streptomyces sp. NRRL F-5123 TaxID=1463856 RepID=UPI0004E0BD03|nr:tetratricopeptide repeat protein [Streptomyces sp. NRRL F-5123]